MRIIGVTGPTGSGKTVLTEYFSGLGIPTIDADALYHSMLVPPSRCLDAIRDAFGEQVIAADGSLDRTVLSEIVFSDAEKLKLLNKTVLKMVIERTREIIAELEVQGNTCVMVDAPTLIEAEFDKECDAVVVVIAPKEDRILRISERDGIDECHARDRVMAQKPDEFYTDVADYVIINDKGEQEYSSEIRRLASKLGF
ncbi:MAG: dephospho-CoA kinase [Ruminococcaceae bacterium]|nr:dephospho-CoA kinase [Oscillospiraceae bacterium]